MYPAIVEIARHYGMPSEDKDEEAWARWEANDDDDGCDTEYMIEWSEAAIDWLNDHVAQDGHSFGWWDGEFFYMPDKWWQEEAGF